MRSENTFEDSDAEYEQVLDPEEYSQRRRMQGLFDARNDVREIKTELRERESMSKHPEYRGLSIDRARACELFRIQLSSYLSEVSPLMAITYPETGKEYLEDVDLGVITVEPPPDLADADPSPDNSYRRVLNPAEPERIAVEGLETLINWPNPAEFVFSAKIRERGGRQREVEEVKEVHIPWRILDAAFTQINKFLAEIGLDLEKLDEQDEETRPF